MAQIHDSARHIHESARQQQRFEKTLLDLHSELQRLKSYRHCPANFKIFIALLAHSARNVQSHAQAAHSSQMIDYMPPHASWSDSGLPRLRPGGGRPGGGSMDGAVAPAAGAQGNGPVRPEKDRAGTWVARQQRRDDPEASLPFLPRAHQLPPLAPALPPSLRSRSAP
jgi:hypothetical protein